MSSFNIYMSTKTFDIVTKSVLGTTSTSMPGLVGALDSTMDQTKGIGENGAVEISYSKILENASTFTESFQKSLMALSNGTIQGIVRYKISEGVQETNLQSVLKSLPSSGSDRKLAIGLLISLIFQVRDCRREDKRKGARDLFNYLFPRVVDEIPELADIIKPLLALTPEYGYWKDIIKLWATSKEENPLYEACLDLFANQLLDDQVNIATSSGKMSLAGKWAPSEGKKFGKMAHLLAHRIFKKGTHSQKMKAYRRLVSTLREKIGVTERLMCAKKFSEIKFELVPALCLNRHRLAWANRSSDCSYRSRDTDRVQAKKNYKTFLESLTSPDSKGAKGTPVFLHNLARNIMNARNSSDIALLEAQWRDHEKLILEHSKRTGFGLESILCVADVSRSMRGTAPDISGSMRGTPMNLAIALSVMVARLQTGIWKGRILTFHTSPTWVILKDSWSVKKCLHHVAEAPWGCNTNFVGTHQLILDVMKENHLSASDLPKALMVISHMQFNRASQSIHTSGSWITTRETLQKMYTEVGFKLPPMIFWDTRGDTIGMPVTEKEEGALMVNGFSTGLLKILLEDGVDALMECTPWKILLKTLTSERYQRVWSVVL